MKKQLLLLIPLLFILVSCQSNRPIHPVAENGELVLSQTDFTSKETIRLDGEWKFFWNELLTESDIIKRINNNVQPDILVPSKWEDELGTSYGYGTYYLKVTIPEEKVGNTLAFTTTNQNTSYTLFVNGVRIASNGYVGTSATTSEAEFSNRVVFFTPRNRELHIVLHVSNYIHPIGGATNSIYFGTSEQILNNYDTTLAYTMFIIGAILVMGICELFIYFFRRNDRVFLYSGIFSMFISVYSILKPPYYFAKIVPSISWNWEHRVEVICIYLLFFFYLHLAHTMYPHETKKTPRVMGISISIGAILLTLFTSPKFYLPLLDYIVTIIMVYMVYFIYVLIIASIKKRPAALVNLIANILFFGAVLNDVFLSLKWIHSIPFTTIGFFFYVLIQSINLSKLYAKNFDNTEKLSVELQKWNASLDEKIKERTEELKRKNDELKRLTLVDGLTGIYNRRYFDEYMSKHFEEAVSSNCPLSVLMIDVDNFKKYNDTNGHIAGDELLKSYSQLINEMCSGDTFVARYGGEEFVVVLPKTSQQNAVLFAKDIRLLIEEQRVEIGVESKYVTMSIGVSSTEQHAFTRKEELIDRADQALYQSKKNGKNQVTWL